MNADLLKRYKPGRLSKIYHLIKRPLKAYSTKELGEMWGNFLKINKPEPEDFEAGWYILRELDKRTKARQKLMQKLGGRIE